MLRFECEAEGNWAIYHSYDDTRFGLEGNSYTNHDDDKGGEAARQSGEETCSHVAKKPENAFAESTTRWSHSGGLEENIFIA